MVWIAEPGWPAAVDAAGQIAGADADVELIHVLDDTEEVVHGAFAGLFGRGQKVPATVDLAAMTTAKDLLDAAAARLAENGQPQQVGRDIRQGRVEREVVAAAEHADLLVLSRDGDGSRLGPRSLGPAGRFIVDHAPCPVLLVWPGAVPGVQTIPPPPTRPPGRPGHPPEHPPGHPPPP
jgi:nucleotide-binding universal stress UspA family protein